MKQKTIIMSYMHWRVMVDAAENVGLESQAIIVKVSNAIDSLIGDDVASPHVSINLWDREIKELIETVSNGKVYNPDGDRYIREAFEILKGHKDE